MKSFLKEIESKFKEIQEQDHNNDDKENFADIMIARMMKSGMSKEDAIAKVKNKKYNEEAKPDFLDLDGDGDTEEDMKDAAADANEAIDEMNTTAAVPGDIQTPYAFSTKAQAKKKKKIKYESVQSAMDQKYAAMIESYSKFVTEDSKLSPAQKVNNAIKDVAKKLQEIEKVVGYTSRLKKESDIAGSTYGKSTHKALHKISERLLKISERIRSLGE